MNQQVAHSTPSIDAPVPGVPASVEASLSYIVRTDGKPAIDTTRPNDRVDHNAHWSAYSVEIENGRLSGGFSLDREGFAFTRHGTAVTDFDDEDEIRRVYYPEMERLLERETGAGRVHVFDHNVRRDGGVPADGENVRQPVRRIHNDYTLNSAPRRIEDLLGPEQAKALKGRRVAMVNVWRPIRGPVETAPLALADASSVPSEDVVAADLIYADRVGEIYYAAYNPAHRWVYFPQLERDEALLIKGYDTADDGRARFSLHTAFDDPTSPENAAPRESIEVRALVVFE
ncbi:MAG: CmcJ/NvfI family oxidoreductase [Hyphomicrobiales bacterium]